MPYKTIVLNLLEDRPRLQELLQHYRQLVPTLERYAQELKTSHEAWKARLLAALPESDPAQIANEALELAVAELTERLPAESTANDQTFSLDEAMASWNPRSSDG